MDDAGPMMTDAGGDPDAGDSCGCPTLPAVCSPPVSGQPTFAPDEGPFGEQLASLIGCANDTLRIAMYQSTWSCLADLVQQRLDADADLIVEIVVDDDQCAAMGAARDCALGALASHARVSIVDDSRSRLMHHKFVSADGLRVWASSANFTRNSFCSDFNNSVVVEQPEIVAAYEAQFDRMFNLGGFGPVAAVEPARGGNYALYFSPQTPIASPARWFSDMVAAIDAATTSVDVMTNAWTRTEVSDALVAAAGRGVAVRAVVDDTYFDDAPAQALLTAGIETRHDAVHSKVMVIDGQTVITGSPNWSAAAWANNEASLWIDDATVASAYALELDRIWATATAVP